MVMAVVMGEAAKLMGVLQNQPIPDDECEYVFLHFVCIVYIYATYVHVCPYTHTYSSNVHKTKLKRFEIQS